MVAISLLRSWLISNTTKGPTTSEFLQLLRTSAKFLQSAFFAILYQAFREALHSPCLAAASRIALRLTTRMRNLRIMRSQRQSENSALGWCPMIGCLGKGAASCAPTREFAGRGECRVSGAGTAHEARASSAARRGAREGGACRRRGRRGLGGGRRVRERSTDVRGRANGENLRRGMGL